MLDAELLRAIRSKMGLSVEALAAEIDVPAPLIELWEEGKTKPRAAVWRALIEFVALRGVVTIESEAEALNRQRQSRERLRTAEIAKLAASLKSAQPPRRRRLKS